ncbi:MAG: hypothetical protein P4M11_11060 [Candidatus Pacebacteria bacterium]|nr:hypothetical protein [Candidatus Paceibacterota bacterium]
MDLGKGPDAELWEALKDRMLDKSPLVRRQAIDEVISLLRNSPDEKLRSGVLGLLSLIAMDERRKGLADRVVEGLYQLWTGDVKMGKKAVEDEKINRAIAKRVISDISQIVARKELSVDSVSKLTKKVRLFAHPK